MRTLTLLLLFTQAVSPQTAKLPERPAEVVALVDQARSLPPEFRADTLLRIAGSSLITSDAWKQELIEDAFWSAPHAVRPYMQRADDRTDSVDTNAVRANGLESLTLQTKALQTLVAIDPVAAHKLFIQIPPVELPEIGCSTVFTPEFTAYYQTSVILFNSFTAKQKQAGQDESFLNQLIGSVEYPAQVPPALEMIYSLKISATQRKELLSILAGKLLRVSHGDREFGRTEKSLAEIMGRITVADAPVLLPSLRAYIVKHVAGARCTDNLPTEGEMTISAKQFNNLVTKVDPAGSRYKTISADEAKATSDDGTYQRNVLGRSAQSEQLTDALRWLTHGNRVKDGEVVRWTLEERSSEQWTSHFQDTDKLIRELKEDQENSPEAFFCLKSDALNSLASLAPPGPMRERAMEEYVSFLEDYYPSIENPNLWFTMFRHMLYTARFSDDAKNKTWILAKLAHSTNPIIATYARLEQRIGAPEQTFPNAHIENPQTSSSRR